MNIQEEFNSIFREVFADEDLVVEAEWTLGDVLGWDSLSHAVLLATIEEVFDIEIPDTDAVKFENAGDIMAYVEGKCA